MGRRRNWRSGCDKEPGELDLLLDVKPGDDRQQLGWVREGFQMYE